MKQRKIIYNPELSIAENAQNNNLSESSIRRYIRLNGIDRKRDNATLIQRSISDLKRKDNEITVSQVAKTLNISVNTVKKYLNKKEDVSNIDSVKLSAFDTSKRKFLISTVSESQDEILTNILRLYVKEKRYHCDLTYSKGYFYKKIPQPDLKFDKYPQSEDTRHLSEAYELQDDSLNSIVVDLPFIVRDNKGGNAINENTMANRFNYFPSTSELFNTNYEIIALSYSKLRRKGIMVMKTMDVTYAGKQLWVTHYVIEKALSMGFELLDKFILISRNRLLRADGCIQHHARKFHSYFLVFKKC